MNIVREPFLGGERYVCSHCGHVAEENCYPTDHVNSSAEALLLRDPAQAKNLGISFSGFVACNCDEPDDE